MRAIPLIGLLLFASPASAEVVSAGPNGFHVRQSAQLVVPQQVAFSSFGNVSAWWDPSHSYSGDSANLSLALRPGGCFCERLPAGGVEHLRVSYIDTAEFRVAMTGALGPLLFEATTGVFDVKAERIAGGSRMVWDYKVAGFANGNAATLAPLVDQVLGEQMKRFRTYAATQTGRS